MILASLLALTGVRSEVLTSFGRAALSDQKLEGWRFSWNPTGPLEQMAEADDLTIVTSQTTRGRRIIRRGVLAEDGVLRTDAPSVTAYGVVSTPSGLADGPKRHLIASYSMPRDSRGSVWINDGNLQNKTVSTGTEVKIFLKGILLKEFNAPLDRIPTLFQQSLGPLKQGDTGSIAIGPARPGERGGGLLRYSVEEWPEEKSPPAPRNTLWHPIEAASPQYDSDGSSAAYEAKQAALNESLRVLKRW